MALAETKGGNSAITPTAGHERCWSFSWQWQIYNNLWDRFDDGVEPESSRYRHTICEWNCYFLRPKTFKFGFGRGKKWSLFRARWFDEIEIFIFRVQFVPFVRVKNICCAIKAKAPFRRWRLCRNGLTNCFRRTRVFYIKIWYYGTDFLLIFYPEEISRNCR